jgi:4a-hydroxytetrahydrobiopterin dehydratase
MPQPSQRTRKREEKEGNGNDVDEDGEYRKYSNAEISRERNRLDKDWTIVKGKLHKEIQFESFQDAISFMMRASLEVVKIDHHPEWFNVYDRVVIDLVTHDVRGLSNYDFRLATTLDSILSNYPYKVRRK